MWSVKVPTSVAISKKKRFSLNLNTYRNAHHHTLDKAKKEFEAVVRPLLGQIPRMDGVKLTFTLFTGTQQLTDTSNVCAIVDKFFSDTLVNSEKIRDDNYQVVLSVDYRYGGLAKGDPHMMVTLELVGNVYYDTAEKEQEDMPILTLTQMEIEEGIANHVRNMIHVKEGMEISITLKATRGDEGYTAIVDIHPARTPDPEPTKPGRKAKTTTDAEKPGKSLGISNVIKDAKGTETQASANPVVDPAVETPIVVEPEAVQETLVESPAEAPEPIEVPQANNDDNHPPANDVEVAPTAEAPRSIFGHLRKPA